MKHLFICLLTLILHTDGLPLPMPQDVKQRPFKTLHRGGNFMKPGMPYRQGMLNMPGIARMPGMPYRPGRPNMPGMFNMPRMARMPGMAYMPGPGMGNMGMMPGMRNVPGKLGMGGMPGMPARGPPKELRQNPGMLGFRTTTAGPIGTTEEDPDEEEAEEIEPERNVGREGWNRNVDAFFNQWAMQQYQMYGDAYWKMMRENQDENNYSSGDDVTTTSTNPPYKGIALVRDVARTLCPKYANCRSHTWETQAPANSMSVSSHLQKKTRGYTCIDGDDCDAVRRHVYH